MALNREITSQITDLLKKHPEGLSITDIVKRIDINRNTAGRYLENLLVSGQVEMRHFGMAKIYALSDRIPQSAMLSISSDLVMQLDSSLRIIFANEPFLNLLRVTEADLLGKNIEYSAAVPLFEETLENFIANLKTGISGKEWHGTLALNKGDRFYSCHVTPMVFNDGRKGVSVLLEDLTEFRRHEIALQESDARLRSIISAAPVGIGVFSHRVILEVNNHLCQMTGYSAGELIGKSARILYKTQEEFDTAGREKYELIAQTGSGTVQTQWQRKDGAIIDILLSSAPLNPEDLSSGVTFTALDITKRTHAEEALRKSEDRYRLLAEGSNDGIFVIGRDDRVEYVNRFGASMLNKSATEIIGSRRSSLFPADVAGNQAKQLHSVFETGVPARSEGPICIKGRIHWFDHVLMPLKDPDGRIRSVLGVSRDITDRLEAEKALRESEQNYRGVIENLQDVFYRVDNTGRIVMASPSVTDMFGYNSEEEVIGLNLADLYLEPKQREKFLEQIKKTGSVRNFEAVLKQKDGTPVIVSTSSHYYYDANGVILGIEGIAKDITEWKRTAQARQESEDRYRKLVEISPDAIIVHSDGKIIYVNPAAQTLVGASCPEEMVGKPVIDFIVPGFRDVVRENIQKDLNGELSPQTELQMRRLDGTSVIVEGRGVKTLIDGKPAIQVAIRDITERKEKEVALITSEDRYRRLLEQSFDAVIIHKEGKICVANDAALAIAGVQSQTDLIGRSIFDFIHHDSRKMVKERVTTLESTESVILPPAREKFIRPDGRIVDVEVMATRFNDNGIPAIQVVFREIAYKRE